MRPGDLRHAPVCPVTCRYLLPLRCLRTAAGPLPTAVFPHLILFSINVLCIVMYRITESVYMPAASFVAMLFLVLMNREYAIPADEFFGIWLFQYRCVTAVKMTSATTMYRSNKTATSTDRTITNHFTTTVPHDQQAICMS